MSNPARLYFEVAIGVATLVVLGFLSGFAAGALGGDRSIVIGAGATGFFLAGVVLAVRLWRMAHKPEIPELPL
jgi:hypothetical protein